MFKFIVAAGCCIFLCSESTGQSFAALSISDKVPAITLSNFLDNPGKKISLSGLKGKLIILDFWNVNCASCITAMPKMDSLQQEFGEKIKIILVTQNTASQVRRLFSKIKIPKPNLPIVFSDTILNQLFPHSGDPLHVWIDPKGYVQAITYDYNTNSETVSRTLSGQPVKLSRRWDYGIDTDYPLVSEQNKEILSLATHHSVLLQGSEEYSSTTSVNIERDSLTAKPYSIQAVNVSLYSLYKIAYNSILYGFDANLFELHRNNRVHLEVKDSLPFFPPADKTELGKWIREHQYAYETAMPATSDRNIYSIMQQDLNRFFDYEVSIEKRLFNCLAIVRTSTNDKIKTAKPFSKPGITQKDNGAILITNMPLKESLLKKIVYANYFLEEPIIDDTDYNQNIDIQLTAPLSDINALRKNLKLYDLDIVLKQKEIEVLVIRDKKNQ